MYVKVGHYGGDVKPLARMAAALMERADGATHNFVGYKATRLQQLDDVRETFGPVLAEVFPGSWPNALITQVLPQGCIPPHHDVPPDGTVRHHLVLATNPLSWVMHDGDWQQMEEGGIYTMDPGKTHAAVNWGREARTHLVIDLGAK